MIRRVAFLLLLCAGSTIVLPENAAPADAAELKHRIGTSAPLSKISAAFTAADDKAIEVVPELNETDNKAIQTFSETGAGKKLLLEHALQSAPITAQIKDKIVSLLPTCAPQK